LAALKKARANDAKTAAPAVEKKAAAPAHAEELPPLEQAKADFLANDPEFSLANYALDDNGKRAVVIWRRDQAMAATPPADAPPAVNPPDAAPNSEPVDLSVKTVGDFDFTGVPGVGEATEENIREYIREKNILRLVDLLDEDLTKVKKVGKATAENLKD